jgi:hypothetical protein
MLAVAVGLTAGGVLYWRGVTGLALVAGVVLVAALVVWVVVMPGRLAPPLPEEELARISDTKARLEAADARLRLRSDLRNGALQLMTVLAVLAGASLGFQQLTEDRKNAAAGRELTRQGQASERFTRAISQLGDTRVETRIGGIYGLAQVADQAPDNNGPVGEVLLAYVNRLPRPKTPTTAPLSEYAPDLQAALTVLTQRDGNADGIKDYAWLAYRLDLHALGLSGADLDGANLSGADLHGAYLDDAKLHGANLSAAEVRGAARFRHTDLDGANLSGADLGDANFNGAYLEGVDLGDTNLSDADLRYAKLRGADLIGTVLISADLEGVDLRDARLQDANLRDANLSNADLRGADLRDAMTNSQTTWPGGFDWRRAGVRIM